MTEKEWQRIAAARDLLCLGDAATLGEIKRAYHRLCKKYHPDVTGETGCKAQDFMYRLTESYNLLLGYVEEYRYPLRADRDTNYEAEDWWMDRFGQDPLWGKQETEDGGQGKD